MVGGGTENSVSTYKTPLYDTTPTNIATWTAHNQPLLDGGEGKTPYLLHAMKAELEKTVKAELERKVRWREPVALVFEQCTKGV